MTPATAAPAPAGRGPAGLVEWQRLLLMSALLATALTIYGRSAFLLMRWPGLGPALVDVGGTWITQFGASLAMLGAVASLYRRRHDPAVATARRLVLLVLACTGAGVAVQGVGHLVQVGFAEFKPPNLYFLPWSVSLATLIVLAHHFAERSRHAAGSLHDAELGRVALERELASARVQLLQAQVEPHFIFNALANVRRLMRTDAAAARTLLSDLLRYLEEALPRLRDENTTLGREAELVRAYLAVHQVRMGQRQRFEVDVPGDLASRPMPPMLLLTLVENALKHGLQPMVEGGQLTVRARTADGQLTITVADTGRGMGSGSGHGTGLANVRARLKAMYGAQASLALAVNEPRGVVATLTLPDAAR